MKVANKKGKKYDAIKMKQEEILVKSSLDGTMQSSLFYKSESKKKRPLLAGLHTWSHDRFNQIENMLPYAGQRR